MRYKILIWFDIESRDFILKNTDIVEAALNFIFWDNYTTEFKELSAEIIERISLNNEGQMSIRDLISVFRKANKVNVGSIDIIFISKDLYYQGKEYIFAGTHVPTKTIVISLYRLSRDYTMKNIEEISTIRKRVFKELLHELGHLLGLDHCSNTRCVMSFSPDLYSLDNKLPFYCSNCVDKLKRMGYEVLGSEYNF